MAKRNVNYEQSYGVWLYCRGFFFTKRWEQLQITFSTTEEAQAWVNWRHPNVSNTVEALY